jgi:hypothetical protein
LEDFIQICTTFNLDLYRGAALGKWVYKDHTRRDVEFLIGRVRAGGKGQPERLRRIHSDFKWRGTSAQCAYLLRSMSGMQVFPDGNHRTAFSLLRSLLWVRGVGVRATVDEAADLVRMLKDPRSAMRTTGLRKDRLTDRDSESFRYIEQWFRNRLFLASLRRALRLTDAVPPLEPWDWGPTYDTRVTAAVKPASPDSADVNPTSGSVR